MADWQTLGSTSLAGALNDEAYRNYVSDVVGRENGGMPMDYETWKNSYLTSWNVPTNADLNQYNINTLSSDGSQWGGQLAQQVMKQGETTPVFQDSWRNGGRWSAGELAALTGAMFGGGALLADALGAGAAGGAAGGAGGTAGAGAGGTAASTGTLAAGDGGLTALGSSMSPQALGLTAVTPGATAAELAALSSGIPSLTPTLTDLALQGAIRGAVTGGVKGLVTGQNPFQSAFSGAMGGGLTGGIAGGVNALNPAGAGWVNSGITGGIASALGGGNPFIGAVGGAAGSLANSGMSSLTQPTNTTGANMDFGGDWFSNWSPDSLNLSTDITGNVLPIDLSTFSGGNGLWNPEYGNWVSDWASGMFRGGADGGGSGGFGSAILNGLKGAIGSASGSTGGGENVAALLGAALGAASSRSGTQTQSRAPWEAAQPYLKGLLADAEVMGKNLAANPFTPQQTQAYGNAYAGLDQARAAFPGLLQQGNFARPSYDQLFGGSLRDGSQTPQVSAQPTVQAGGVRGLLGNDDRAKALMMRGRAMTG